jgi:glycosyltransferase involved in cell wall biosynthesis
MIDTHKRISIFMPSLAGGGGERSMLNLAHGLADSGHEVDLVLARVEGPFVKEVRSSIRIVDLRASRAMTSLFPLVRYLRRQRPAAMLSVFGYANIVASWAWRIAGVPTRLLLNEQNTISMESQNTRRWRGRLVPRLIRYFYPWANGIVVVSNGVREDMARLTHIPSERIAVIYNPSVVREEVWKKAQAPIDHPWLLSGEPPVLLAVGRLQVQKDFPNLLRAFALLRQERKARLMILGEGPERPQLEELTRKLGLEADVSLPGFVDNPYAYMSRASVFVLSSRYEGLPTVLIEALCCGTPVVATDCPSGPREILKDGKYGQLVPVGDSAGLAAALRDTLDGKAVKPPAASWEPYDLHSVVSQYADLLLQA